MRSRKRPSPLRAGGRPADEGRGDPVRGPREGLARGRAADLLVCGEEDTQGSTVPGPPDRLEQHDEPAFHVVDARPPGAALRDAPREARERPPRPDRVEVAEQEERRPGTREVGADVLALEHDRSAERAQLVRGPVAQARRVAGRRLELDELSQELDHGPRA